MRAWTRRWLVAALATLGVWALPGVALAHGVGVRGDLPLPLWAVSYGAVGVLVITFVTLVRLWPRPRFEGDHASRALPTGLSRAIDLLEWPVRLIGVAALGVVLAAALTGSDITTRNPAPFVLYVAVWVGMALVQPILGDVWRWLNPFETVAVVLERLDLVDDQTGPARWGHWPAVAVMGTFLWLELVYTEPGDPRAVGVWIALYVALVLLPGAFLGAGWVRAADAFGVFFTLLAHLSPFHRDEQGRIAVRPPLVGLAGLRPLPGTAALVLVTLGGTTFDGVSRTDLWADNVLAGSSDGRTMVLGTLGLLVTVGIVWGLYRYAVNDAAATTRLDAATLSDAFAHSLVPIALGYAVAHYFSLLVFEGQRVLALLSDPFSTGADLFGTADWAVDYTVVSTTTIGVVQVAGIVLGHVAGVVLAHDRAVALFERDVQQRGQYGMLVAMVAYTVGGLLLLLGA